MDVPRIGPVNAATPTPLNPDGTFDKESAKRLCRRWVDIGLDGVLVLGSMGEGLFTPENVRNAWIETALEEVGDKLTIMVSTADLSAERMRERVMRYARMGVHYVVLCLPTRTAVAKAVADVKALAEACPAPCGYYDVPPYTGTNLVVEEIVDILSHPNIHACKDSNMNALISYGITSAEYRPAGVTLLDGCEYRTPVTRLVGYDGMLHGGGVLTGRWARAIWDKVGEGKVDEAVAMDREKAFFLASVYNRFSRPLQNTIGQKHALKVLGCMDHDTVIIDQSMNDAHRARIADAVEKYREWLTPAG